MTTRLRLLACTFAFAAATAAGAASLPSAHAAERCNARTLQGCKSQFVDFGNQVLNGTIHAPKVELFTQREEIRHARMLQLKKELLPLIGASRGDRALR